MYDYLKKVYTDLLDDKTGLNEEPCLFIKNNNFDEIIGNDDLCFY